jgi:hypothetical protein
MALALAFLAVQGYQTSFDDLTGWLPGGTSPPITWANDATPSMVPGGATRTGAASLNYNNGTDYDSPSINNTGVVYSPVIDLAGLVNPTLSFWCNFHTQPGSEDALSMRDSRQVALAPGYPYPLINETLGGPTFGACSAMGTWHRHDIPLNPAWGVVQVVFVFGTVDSLQNGYSGWFIDDFAVSEPLPPPTGGGGGGGGGATPAPSGGSSNREGEEGCGLTGLETILLLAGLRAWRRAAGPRRPRTD